MSQLGHIKTLAHQGPGSHEPLCVPDQLASSSPTANSWVNERERERQAGRR